MPHLIQIGPPGYDRAAFRELHTALEHAALDEPPPFRIGFLDPLAGAYVDLGGLVPVEVAVELPATARAMLLVEVDGDLESMDRSVSRVREVLEPDAVRIVQSDRGEELWEIRRYLSPAVARIRPAKINEDVVVPRSRVPDYLEAIEQLESDCGLPIVCFGHVGDGNIHVNLMLDTSDEDQVVRAEAAKSRIFELAVEMGGTISGEHGIGIMKADFLPMALGAGAIDAMKAVKRALDPNDIMNPGKIFV